MSHTSRKRAALDLLQGLLRRFCEVLSQQKTPEGTRALASFEKVGPKRRALIQAAGRESLPWSFPPNRRGDDQGVAPEAATRPHQAVPPARAPVWPVVAHHV